MSDETLVVVSGNTLSDGQEIALSLMYIFSSLLSLIGSSTIVYKVLSNRRNATTYDRLMLGLSTSDIIGSIGYSLYPFLGPKEKSPRVWAFGTDASCSAVGFLTQMGFSAALYNGFLSFYYLFTVRYGMNRMIFARRYEPSIHVIAIIFSVITATLGAAKGYFSEVQVGLGCWVNDYPRGCYDDCLSEEIGWVYGGAPIFFALLSLIVNNTLVYLHVRHVFRTTHVVETERLILQKMQTWEVATQGFLYVFNWFFCFWSPIAVRVIEAFSYTVVDESEYYWLLMFQGATLPLQGFLNMFVYNRPNFKRVRAAYPHLSMVASIRKACLDSKIPKLTEITRLSGPQMLNKNKYKKKSASAFSSDLANVPEGSHEESESTEYNNRVGAPRMSPFENGGGKLLESNSHPTSSQPISSEGDLLSPSNFDMSVDTNVEGEAANLQFSSNQPGDR